MDEGQGSYIGFHHATLLGEFDGYRMWDWDTPSCKACRRP